MKREDASVAAKQGAEGVLAELRRQQDGRELLRAGDRDAAVNGSQLLRGAAGVTEHNDQLLHAASPLNEEPHTRNEMQWPRV
jgi:hypothetical protein